MERADHKSRRTVGVVLAAFSVALATWGSPAAASPLGIRSSNQQISEFADDIRTAVVAIDGYWSRHFPEFFGVQYQPPRLYGNAFGLYTQQNAPICGGRRVEAGNAFYCPDGHFLGWDQGLLLEEYDAIGDAWVYFVIAHEWGHAVQAHLRREYVPVYKELQADCLAAVALYGAAADGTISFELGDEAEIENALVRVGDALPWTRPGDHGNIRQRIGAFDVGREGGVNACFS